MGIISWIIDNKEWLFSGIGVAILSFLFGFFFKWDMFRLLKGIKLKKTKHNLSAMWDCSGFDIPLLKVKDEAKLEYDFELQYEGRLSIKHRGLYLKIIGHVTGFRGEDKSKRDEWTFDGKGILMDSYVIVAYKQYSRKYAPTFGLFFLKLDTSGTNINGYFLAKRSIDDRKGDKKGIGFGSANFSKV